MMKDTGATIAHAATLALPGARVLTAAGDAVTVAMVQPDGTVLAWRHGCAWPVPVVVRGDAWGGEYDQAMGLAA